MTPQRVQWLDAHEVYKNNRGLTIIQNHFTFALKLSEGDQSLLEQLPETVALKERTQRFINDLSTIFPSLANRGADELPFHLYNDKEVGLSRHRDNMRFIGLIAIIALSGECDLVITHKGEDIELSVIPGDLCLLRAPGLIDSAAEVRPEHYDPYAVNVGSLSRPIWQSSGARPTVEEQANWDAQFNPELTQVFQPGETVTDLPADNNQRHLRDTQITVPGPYEEVVVDVEVEYVNLVHNGDDACAPAGALPRYDSLPSSSSPPWVDYTPPVGDDTNKHCPGSVSATRRLNTMSALEPPPPIPTARTWPTTGSSTAACPAGWS